MPIVKTSTQKYKNENSNYSIKVSPATVAKLKQGTKASNIAAANKPGASAELKEAVRRFYGKGTVVNKAPNNAGPATGGPSKTPTIDRSNPKPSATQLAAAKKNNAAKKTTALKESRMNPKPTAAQLAQAKKNKSVKQTKGPSLSTYKKTSMSNASAAARKEEADRRNRMK